MFGRKKQAPVPAANTNVPNAEAPQQAGDAKRQEWNDEMARKLPSRSTYFTAVRTNAYESLNAVENCVEFWAAVQVDAENDKWRIMNYRIYDLDREDGKFASEVAKRDPKTGKPVDVSFAEALYEVGKYEFISDKMTTAPAIDLQSRYPADEYPELAKYYYDVEYYKAAGNIEGIAFDGYNQPFRRIEGRIFASGEFTRNEIARSLLAAEQPDSHPLVKARLEAGLLSDVYNTASSRAASFEDIIKASTVLSALDDFAVGVTQFYLALQKEFGLKEGLTRVEGISDDDKSKLTQRVVRHGMDTEAAMYAMESALVTVKSAGAYAEPFEKFAAECGLYLNLLRASKTLASLEGGFSDIHDVSRLEKIAEVKASVEKAQENFENLGGTPAEMDKLKAWVANRRKEEVPAWLPGFVTRHYQARARVVEQMQKRKANAQDLKVLPAVVKPPVSPGATDDKLQRTPQPDKGPAA